MGIVLNVTVMIISAYALLQHEPLQAIYLALAAINVAILVQK